jgi:RNA polymerase sigma-70 factor, ECF subfamily
MEELSKKFIEAFEENADNIYRFCLFRLGDKELAKDLAQITFLKTWDYVSKKGEISNLRAFLFKVARNLIIDHYRLIKTDSLDALMEEGMFEPVDNESVSAEERSDALLAYELLKQIPNEYKEVVMLRYAEGMSFREIAQITGETENAVAVRCHRAVKKVREMFDKGKK